MNKNQAQDNDLPAGLAQPARRALAGVGIQRLDQLTHFTEDEIWQLHGIGPHALGNLRRAMSARGLEFARE